MNRSTSVLIRWSLGHGNQWPGDLILTQDDRKILFIVDIEGAKGKTAFGKIMEAKEDNVVYQAVPRLASVRDRAHMMAKQLIGLPKDKRPIIIFDISRCHPQRYWPLKFIEYCKDGNIISTKDHGVHLNMCWTQVAILCSEKPIISSNKDRYQIFEI